MKKNYIYLAIAICCFFIQKASAQQTPTVCNVVWLTGAPSPSTSVVPSTYIASSWGPNGGNCVKDYQKRPLCDNEMTYLLLGTNPSSISVLNLTQISARYTQVQVSLIQNSPGTFTYNWTFNISGSTTYPFPINFASISEPAGLYDMIVTATDVNGSTITFGTMHLTILPTSPNLTIVPSGPSPCSAASSYNVCFDISPSIPNLGTNFFSYFEIDGVGADHFLEYPDCFTLTPGTHNIRLVTGDFSNGDFPVYVNCIPTLTVTYQAPPTVTISPASGSYCSNSGMQTYTVTATGGTPGYTYTWNNSSMQPGSPSNVFNLNTATATSGTYTVTVTDANGCTATASTNITITQNCCAGSSITCNGQTRQLTYANVNMSKIYADVCGTNNTIDLSLFGTDKRIAINGTLTIDGNYTFKNCTYTNTNPSLSGGITFAQGAKIRIPATRTLTIENSYLFACGNNMWAGIELEYGGTLNTQKNTSPLGGGKPIIADAIVAINGVSNKIGKANLNDTRFYRDMYGLNIPNTADYIVTGYTGTVNGCSFSYNTTDPLQNYMLAPNAGKKMAVAIFANYMVGWFWSITNPTGGVANTFDGINCGVYAYQSNVWVGNNTFNNIDNYDNVNASSGKAVYCASVTGGSYGNSIVVQTNSDLSSTAAFNNCLYGVYITNAHSIVRNNKMNNITYGIYSSACPAHTLDFNHNVIGGTMFGITFNNVLGQYAVPSAANNNITTNEPAAPFITTYGIAHLETTNTSVGCNGGTRDCRPLIENNSINNGRYGIYVNNAYGTRITTNTINLASTVSSTINKAGIYLSGANMPLVTNNTITGNGAIYDETPGVNSPYLRSGLRVVNSTAEMCGNIFNTIGYSAEFIGGCNGAQLKGNQINFCRYGVVLKNNGATGGIIGAQGASSLTHGNVFNGNGSGNFNNTGNFRTFCFNSDGSFSPFFVVSPVSSQQPEPNGQVGGVAITKNTSSTYTSWSCANLKSNIITQGDLYSKDIAEGKAANYMEYGFEESGAWLAEKNLYEQLKEDEQMLHSKKLFEDFYEAKQQSATGELEQVDNTILLLTDTAIANDSSTFETLRLQALAQNTNANITTVQEQNRQWVNEVYLNTVAKGITEFSVAQQQQLYNLAAQCPYVAGDAVYSARTLYNLIDHTAFFEDEQICTAVASYKKEQIKKQTQTEINITLSPNPAQDYADVMVKGQTGELMLLVHNTLGELIASSIFAGYAQINTAQLPNGLYNISISRNGTVISSQRLVVSK